MIQPTNSSLGGALFERSTGRSSDKKKGFLNKKPSELTVIWPAEMTVSAEMTVIWPAEMTVTPFFLNGVS